MPAKILIIDDEKDMLLLIARILSGKTSHEIDTTDSPLLIPELLKQKDYDVIVTDLKMPHWDGIQVLELAKERDVNTAVIVMTAYGTIESAIEATRKGAFDYITKPFRKERILHVVEQAVKWRRMQMENLYLREKLEGKPRFPALIGNSPAMEKLKDQIDRVAETSATVLITGESGTGKELVARALHSHSLRKDKPFIPIDCSTIPESIIESELFGHLKGSFTGAHRDKKGLVEEAHEGTLFLDEIGDLNPTMQVKLLRLLQEGEYKVIGSNAIRKVDIRFIAATHQNLQEKIKNGEFREDLFYRLNVINLQIPPVRRRVEDIPVLARYFLEKYSILYNKNIKGIGREALDYLTQREWPGNVRELENVMERGVIMALGDELEVGDLWGLEENPPPSPSLTGPGEDIFSLPFKEAKDRLMEDFQTQYITKVLARHSGNVSQAARESGLKRQYLHRLIRDIKVESKTFRKPEPAD